MDTTYGECRAKAEIAVAVAQTNLSIAAELCARAQEVCAESARLRAQAERLRRPRRARLHGLVLFGAPVDVTA